jgi:hypothetical protein
MEHIDPGKDIHFETNDYTGIKIICTVLDWEHICRAPHEYMEGEEQEVIDTLRYPDYGVRYHDADYPETRRVYYMTHNMKKCFVKVIVEFQDKASVGNGRIITAYETVNLKDGERLEFPE